jgi:hypothetical protein
MSFSPPLYSPLGVHTSMIRHPEKTKSKSIQVVIIHITKAPIRQESKEMLAFVSHGSCRPVEGIQAPSLDPRCCTPKHLNGNCKVKDAILMIVTTGAIFP